MRSGRLFILLACAGCGPASQGITGELTVFNAGSLAYPFRELLSAFGRTHPGVTPRQESSGSLEAARKLTELGKIPDVLAVADYNVIGKLLLPRYATWYVTFASNAMVLAYSGRSTGAGEISGENWWRFLLRPEIRWGSSDPALDPNGYRTLMVMQLAERHYGQPGLGRRLADALDPRFTRPSEAQLLGLVQAGELDYAWSYRSLAATAGLRWVDLPAAIDLSDASRGSEYAAAVVRLPGGQRESADSVEFRGEPIVYALTIPREAPHRETALAFVRFVLSPAGREILAKAGFRLLERPLVTGSGEPERLLP
jgi:molybdate/tungstate transport system substrate-binding protein